MEPTSCCPKGSWPALQSTYEPKGTTFNIDNFPAYTIGDSPRTLILISDIFGAFSGRHQSVADTFASFGYTVLAPEILPTPYTGQGEMMKLISQIKFEEVERRFQKVIQYLEGKGVKQFFAAGFCWGVYAAFKLSAKYNNFINIIGYHPSLRLCGVFGESEVTFAESVQCPAYFVPAQNDPENVKTGGELVEILKKRFGEEKVGTTEFPQQIHGWVVRGDVNKPEVQRDVQEALKIGRDYLSKF